MLRRVPKVLGVGKSSPHCPLAPVERCLDRADPLSPIADSRFRVQAGWLSYIPCWSGGQQPRSKCQLTLAHLWAVGRVCPICPPSLPGHCWPWWACLGLESSAFLFTLSFPMCPSNSVFCMGTAVLLEACSS